MQMNWNAVEVIVMAICGFCAAIGYVWKVFDDRANAEPDKFPRPETIIKSGLGKVFTAVNFFFLYFLLATLYFSWLLFEESQSPEPVTRKTVLYLCFLLVSGFANAAIAIKLSSEIHFLWKENHPSKEILESRARQAKSQARLEKTN